MQNLNDEETSDGLHLEHFGFDLDEQKRRILLGKGSAGNTYRGWVEIKDASGRPNRIAAALKEIGEVRTTGPNSLQREISTLAKVRNMGHPGLVRFLRFFYHKHTPFIATELVVGETLDSAIQRAKLKHTLRTDEWLRQVLSWGAHLAAALERMWKDPDRPRLVHRDIKPANVMIRKRDEQPVLIDFGIGRSEVHVNDDGSTTVGEKRFVGTPNFASPEQFCTGPETCEGCQAKPCRLTPRADIYALGVTLWRAATDQYLYHDECMRMKRGGDFADYSELVRMKRTGLLPGDLAEGNLHGGGPRFDELIALMTRGDPDERPNATEVREALEEMLGPQFLAPDSELPTIAVENLENEYPLERLPRFVRLREGLEIASNLLQLYAVNYWSDRELDRVDYDQNVAAPARTSYSAVCELLEALNRAEESNLAAAWHYRLPTVTEWLDAAGLTRAPGRASASLRIRRALDDAGREHEWCEDPDATDYEPECRPVYSLHRQSEHKVDAPVLDKRHVFWPKGVIRLVREARMKHAP